MKLKEYIASGILELYVYGVLSEEESIEVSKKLHEHPEIASEVAQIENALQQLGTAIAPHNAEKLLASIKQKLVYAPHTSEIKEIKTTQKPNYPAYMGWAACILLAIGLFTVLFENDSLRDKMESVATENTQLEEKIENAREGEEEAKKLLDVFRDQALTEVALKGQKIAPEILVSVIWNKKNNKAFIDAKQLPVPPSGTVYQVWSLTLNPLKPTSIGLLKDFAKDENKIFVLPNPNNSEAFGVTLEPAGGSKTPTMEKLYVLGVIGAKS